MKRRDVLKALPLGAIAAGVPFSFGGFAGRAFGKSPLLGSLLNAQSNDGKVLVIINMQGGNDGLNTVIPYNDPKYVSNRGTIGFTSQADRSKLDGFKLGTSGLAINPNMEDGMNAKFLTMFNEGKVAVVQNVGYADPNLSHFRSTDIWNTASDSSVILSTGWVGRYLEQAVDPSYPTDVKVGDDPLAMQINATLSPIFQGSRLQMGIAVGDPSNYTAATNYADDPPANTNAGAELAFVRTVLEQSDIYGTRFNALFPNHQKPTSTTKYPSTNALALQLQKVAWCVKQGMTTKVYFVNIGSFDTHVLQNSKDPQSGQGFLLNYLAEAISLFQANLEEWGIQDKVVGMTYSEFGRRVNENGSKGTDHGTCAPQFIFGSQVNGAVYGPNPDLVNLDSNLDLVWKVDFRQLYASVLGDWFGVDQNLRKAILMDTTTQGERFDFSLPLNGSGTKQSLFKSPQAVSNPANVASDFILHQNYPNPFNPTTTIKFAVTAAAPTVLEVFDVRGSLLKTLVNERMSRGEHEVTFDASRLSSGTYFYRLQVGSEVQTKSMTLAK